MKSVTIPVLVEFVMQPLKLAVERPEQSARGPLASVRHSMRFVLICLVISMAILPLRAAEAPAPANDDWDAVTHIAQMQFKQMKLAEAAQSSKRALQIAKRSGPSDDHVGINYFQLGNIYREWGHCTDARTNFSHAIAVWEKQPAPNHKYVFNTVISLLDSMSECEDCKGVEKTFREYEAKLEAFQSGPVDQAALLALRGTVSRTRKNYGQAEIFYRRAIELEERTPAISPLEIEQERSNLAMVVDKQGRHAEALAEEEQVIAFFEQNGVLRPATLAGSLNNAACALADLGRTAESERMFERAVTLAQNAFGEDTRFTAKIILNYARVLRENKEGPAAEAWQKRGVETFRRALLRDNATVDLRDLR